MSLVSTQAPLSELIKGRQQQTVILNSETGQKLAEVRVRVCNDEALTSDDENKNGNSNFVTSREGIRLSVCAHRYVADEMNIIDFLANNWARDPSDLVDVRSELLHLKDVVEKRCLKEIQNKSVFLDYTIILPKTKNISTQTVDDENIVPNIKIEFDDYGEAVTCPNLTSYQNDFLQNHVPKIETIDEEDDQNVVVDEYNLTTNDDFCENKDFLREESGYSSGGNSLVEHEVLLSFCVQNRYRFEQLRESGSEETLANNIPPVVVYPAAIGENVTSQKSSVQGQILRGSLTTEVTDSDMGSPYEVTGPVASNSTAVDSHIHLNERTNSEPIVTEQPSAICMLHSDPILRTLLNSAEDEPFPIAVNSNSGESSGSNIGNRSTLPTSDRPNCVSTITEKVSNVENISEDPDRTFQDPSYEKQTCHGLSLPDHSTCKYNGSTLNSATNSDIAQGSDRIEENRSCNLSSDDDLPTETYQLNTLNPAIDKVNDDDDIVELSNDKLTKTTTNTAITSQTSFDTSHQNFLPNSANSGEWSLSPEETVAGVFKISRNGFMVQYTLQVGRSGKCGLDNKPGCLLVLVQPRQQLHCIDMSSPLSDLVTIPILDNRCDATLVMKDVKSGQQKFPEVYILDKNSESADKNQRVRIFKLVLSSCLPKNKGNTKTSALDHKTPPLDLSSSEQSKQKPITVCPTSNISTVINRFSVPKVISVGSGTSDEISRSIRATGAFDENFEQRLSSYTKEVDLTGCKKNPTTRLIVPNCNRTATTTTLNAFASKNALPTTLSGQVAKKRTKSFCGDENEPSTKKKKRKSNCGEERDGNEKSKEKNGSAQNGSTKKGTQLDCPPPPPYRYSKEDLNKTNSFALTSLLNEDENRYSVSIAQHVTMGCKSCENKSLAQGFAFRCRFCVDHFISIKSLWRHLNMFHKRFVCMSCGHKSSNKTTHNVHVSSCEKSLL